MIRPRGDDDTGATATASTGGRSPGCRSDLFVSWLPCARSPRYGVRPEAPLEPMRDVAFSGTTRNVKITHALLPQGRTTGRQLVVARTRPDDDALPRPASQR